MAELPVGYREVSEEDRKKAQGFFGHGRTVAATGNYDYAIERYLSGFRYDPDAVQAHQELREISLRRKASGGKALGMLEAMKLKKNTKDDKENLLNAVKLLTYDPGNSNYMLSITQIAAKAGYYDTAIWMAPLLAEAEASTGKPDVNKFLSLRDACVTMAQWRMALECVHVAMRLKPNNMELQVEARNLGARLTMDGAGYNKGGSFRDQVRDMKSQLKLLDADKEVADSDILIRQIADADKELTADPNEPGKVSKLVDLLVKTDDPQQEERAAKLLQEWYDKTKQYRFRLRIGQIRIKQMMRQERVKRKAVTEDPASRKDLEDFRRKLWEFELAEYADWSKAYPTDLTFKFELGKRQLYLRRFDDAIASFQQARADPKQKTDSQIFLSQAFFEAGFLDEADDTLAALIRDFENRESSKFKDMNYLRGRVMEQKGQLNDAIKLYSIVFQSDSAYKDVGARIKRLRAALKEPPPQEKTEEEY